MTATGITAPRDDLFLIVLRECQTFEDERMARLRKRFELTEAQTRVLGLLAERKDLHEIAERLAVSIHTIRLHVKALPGKAECGRQTQRVKLVEQGTGEGQRILI